MIPVFVTGTGTGVGKTVIAAMLCKALGADYWKPVQSGNLEGTDKETIRSLLDPSVICHPEVYNLQLPASPHIAAREEGQLIDLPTIKKAYDQIQLESSSKYLVIEGAGGLMVPLNDHLFIADLVKALEAKLILVSRNYLGSINHSLLTAAACKQYGLDVLGWIFNDDYMHYQQEIAGWTNYPVIGSVPALATVDHTNVQSQALLLRENLLALLEPGP